MSLYGVSSEPARFPTTAWSCIRIAQDDSHPERHEALNRLMTQYWKPVFYFLRARGLPLHRAEDLAQEFFLKVLERDWLQRADQNRGRFRNFLLKVLVRFVADQGPARAPRQQAFEQQAVSIHAMLGEEEKSFEPPAGASPEAIFMRHWAQAVIAGVLDHLRQLYASSNRQSWFELFIAVRQEDATQESLGQRFGMTRDQVRYAIDQVEKRFRRLLLAEVRDQVYEENEVEDEVGELLDLLRAE